jgi:FkbM family methyltransferase
LNGENLKKSFGKLGRAIASRQLLRALLRHRVLAGTEHRYVLTQGIKTIIDVGANRGQFALAARKFSPTATIISFEPLAEPAAIYRKVFAGDEHATLHQVAIGPSVESRQMHVSARDDSSSLLRISSAQVANFPGTEEVGTIEVSVSPLEKFASAKELVRPSLLKLDVQGFEFEALLGCESLLNNFDVIYCECSFVELYSGQKLAPDIIAWLSSRAFELMGIYNPLYGNSGEALQADCMFHSSKSRLIADE